MRVAAPFRAAPFLAALAFCAGVGGSLPASAAARDPSYVQVVEKEWSLELSRQSVRSGSVVLEAVNFGMDAHNLAIQKTAPGARIIRFAKLFHGAHADRTLRLAPGRYALWCTLPHHRARGMFATLRVIG